MFANIGLWVKRRSQKHLPNFKKVNVVPIEQWHAEGECHYNENAIVATEGSVSLGVLQ